MKICLIGEYSFMPWCGSATNKLQRYLLKELSISNDVVIYELLCCSSKLKKLFHPMQEKFSNDGRILSGGVLNFCLYLLLMRFNIIHMMVTRKYMLLLLPVFIILYSKVIVTIHDTIVFRDRKRNLDFYLKILLVACSRTVFVFNESDLRIISRYKSSRTIKIIKNGVDLSIYKPKTRTNSKKIITFAGGLGSDYKGLIFLQGALQKIKTNLIFQICGENPHNISSPYYIGELTGKGFLSQLCRSWLVVIPSRYESFSMTALESMAAGVPIIISDTAGVSAYFRDKYDCLKIRYGDIENLINSIDLLVSDNEYYFYIRSNALNTVRSFSWSSVARDYENKYQSL